MRALAVLQIYRRYLGNSLILTDTRNPDTTSSLPCAQLLSHLQRILDHPLFNISFYVAPHGCSKEVPFWDLLGNYKHKKLRGGGGCSAKLLQMQEAENRCGAPVSWSWRYKALPHKICSVIMCHSTVIYITRRYRYRLHPRQGCTNN